MRWRLLAAVAAFAFAPISAGAEDTDWVFKILRERARNAAPNTPYYPEPRPAIPEPQYDAIREPLPATINIPGNVIVVFVRHQQYSAYIGGTMALFNGVPLRGPVTTGMPGYLTPLTDPLKGAHAVEYKQHDYVSKTYPEPYGGARMPNAMFFDRKGGYALHTGEIPRWGGRPFGVSHGCVRLDPYHAEVLFKHFSDATVKVIVVEDVTALARKWESQYIARTE